MTGATNALINPDYLGPLSYYKFIYIRNDDAAPTVVASLNQSEGRYFDEGDSGTTIAPVTVTLSGASSEVVTVSYRVDGVLSTPGVDFVAATGSLVFEPGQTQASIPVTIYGDTIFEGDEAIEISLTGATNALINPDYLGPLSYYKFIYIRNDDPISG